MKILQWSTFAGACLLSSAAIGYNFQGKNDAQLAALTGALGLSIVSAYAEHRSIEPDQMLQMVKNARLDLFEQILDRQCHQIYDAAVEVAALPQTDTKSDRPATPLQSILTQGVGIALLGNSGSGKSSVVQWLIGESQPDNLVILDPHNDGQTWGGLPVLDDYDQILAKLFELLKELDQRRELKKQGKLITPMMIIGDEWPSIRAYAKKQKSDICDDFILRMGCEARKYKMLSIICNHSGNVKAMGLEGQGDFLENWCLIRLGKVAKKYAKNMSDRAIAATVHSQAYPCLINDELSAHPTHGHYQQFKDGQPPTGIKPYTVLSSTKKLKNCQQTNSSSTLPTVDDWQKYLEDMYQIESVRLDEREANPENVSDSPESLKTNDANFFQAPERFSAFQEPGSKAAKSIPESLKASILKMHLSGMSKGEIIMEKWQAKPGGSKAYQEANQLFEAIKSYWIQLELWEVK